MAAGGGTYDTAQLSMKGMHIAVAVSVQDRAAGAAAGHVVCDALRSHTLLDTCTELVSDCRFAIKDHHFLYLVAVVGACALRLLV